jgi:hypothetical protein
MAVAAAGTRTGRALRRIAGALPLLLLAGCLFDRGGIHVDARDIDQPGRDARPGSSPDARADRPPADAATGPGSDRPSNLAADRPIDLPPDLPPDRSIDRPVDLPPDRPPDRPPDTPPAVTLRININGPAHSGQDFPGAWGADPGLGGVCGPSVYGNPMPIAGTRDDSLFQGESFGSPLVCAVGGGALPPGRYQVNLYFAEIYWGPGCPGGGPGPGSRLFDVRIEGTVVEGSVDLFREAGCAASPMGNGRPVVKRYTAAINDGTLDLRFEAQVDNAKISAIEVLSAF